MFTKEKTKVYLPPLTIVHKTKLNTFTYEHASPRILKEI